MKVRNRGGNLGQMQLKRGSVYALIHVHRSLIPEQIDRSPCLCLILILAEEKRETVPLERGSLRARRAFSNSLRKSLRVIDAGTSASVQLITSIKTASRDLSTEQCPDSHHYKTGPEPQHGEVENALVALTRSLSEPRASHLTSTINLSPKQTNPKHTTNFHMTINGTRHRKSSTNIRCEPMHEPSMPDSCTISAIFVSLFP